MWQVKSELWESQIPTSLPLGTLASRILPLRCVPTVRARCFLMSTSEAPFALATLGERRFLLVGGGRDLIFSRAWSREDAFAGGTMRVEP